MARVMETELGKYNSLPDICPRCGANLPLLSKQLGGDPNDVETRVARVLVRTCDSCRALLAAFGVTL